MTPAAADIDPGPTHPRLQTLRARYAAFVEAAFHRSGWTEDYVAREVDLAGFRGDGAYVWDQRDGNSVEKYHTTAAYVESIDRLGLLERLTEDGAFGARTVRTGTGRIVSRDLLDSIVEIYFLDRALGLAARRGFQVLDIGAGYGRLAHRLAKAFPALGTVHCTDAVPESTFIAELYLRHRGMGDRVRVVPLPDVEDLLSSGRIDLAVNIHSFCNECSRAAVTWWMTRLARYGVRYFMLVPNAGDHGGRRLVTREPDGTQPDVRPVLEAHGYYLVRDEPMYLDPTVQDRGISPTRHYLFKLQNRPSRRSPRMHRSR